MCAGVRLGYAGIGSLGHVPGRVGQGPGSVIHGGEVGVGKLEMGGVGVGILWRGEGFGGMWG